MKRLFFIMFALTLLLAGCQSTEQESSPSENNPTEVVEGSTILSLKQKYGSESEQAIMPMYNVAQDEEFTFKFKADLRKSSLRASDIISIHTDIKALKASDVYAIPETNDNSVSIKPLGWGVLSSDSMMNKDQSSWGGAPIYYIRLNYDPDAEKLTLLDKPIIIPFTVKSELPVPNLRYEIDKDRRFKLVWDKVEGATEYKIYKRSDLTNFDTNVPLTGAEDAFSNSLPLDIAVTTETSFNDFLRDGKGGLGTYNEMITTTQNHGIRGEYYVTAIGGGKESNFSRGVPTAPLASQLPTALKEQLYREKLKNIEVLPQKTTVEYNDGSLARETIVYDTANVEISEFNETNIPFHIKGTALKSYVRVENVTQADLDRLAQQTVAESSNGLVEPKNDTPYVPAPDVPTIINNHDAPESATETEEASASETSTTESTTDTGTSEDATDPLSTEASDDTSDNSSDMASEEASNEAPAPAREAEEDNLVDEQKSNTQQNVEQGNQETVPQPATGDAMINADSALEEVLAKNMIAAQDKISLKAFPEAQNFTTLSDVVLKVMYQNPLILGVEGFEYNYGTLTLSIYYNESAGGIQKKQDEIIAKANEVVASIIKNGMNEDEKRKAIYDYLNDNAKYDDAALENAEQNNFKNVDPQFNDSFTTYGILVKGVGVCASYASVYKLLSDLSGLESIVVTGASSGVPHAWNKVKIGNEWFHVDATNNLTNSGIPYFLYNANDETAASQKTIADQDYWLDSELTMFNGESDANDYYVQNDLEVASINEYKTKAESELKKGENRVILRFASPVDSDELMTAAGEALAAVDEALLNTAQLATLGSYAILDPKPEQK
ncbi:transglutaminase-like domain-containing protein [Paenibacillus xylanexedens]|uniref:transglutaminase domain-containing protein n=1 Tax=Paenibacillus xylanexedens TaxID=528191 RepID=UPI001F2FB98C|nr:transglutaminase-like domain-containing protein [Paenibacillus xylanexedens]MCF7757907.1 transglutaminase-like domain-containing protein [Paenibacillus xylanexedens]